jgi:Flp pilus assembly protein TadG
MGTTVRSRRFGRRSLGQTLVEFALVLPIFFLLLFGLIDVGRLVYMNSTLSQATREAARLGAVEASWLASTNSKCNQPGGPACPANLAAIRSDMLAAGNRMMAPFGSITAANFYTSCDAVGAAAPTGTWTTQTCNTTGVDAVGGTVSVRAVLVFKPITPGFSQMFSSITTSGSATMVIN